MTTKRGAPPSIDQWNGCSIRIPKGYIYFAMAFSVAVEMLNIRMRARRRDAVKLRKRGPAG